MVKPPRNLWTRRHFLQGSGAVIALPYFASLVPKSARAATGAIPTRYVSYFVPLGMLEQYWKPTSVGADYTLPANAVMAPLAAHRAKLTVVSGTRNAPQGRQGGGGHGQGGASANTGMPSVAPNAARRAGISADQIVANARQQPGQIASLQLGMPGENGNADLGLPIEYTGSMSWADATTNLPPVTDRNAVIKRLFPNGSVTGHGTTATQANENAAADAARTTRRQSILDAAVAQARALQARMGSEDRQRFDQYLTGIRQVESSLQANGPAASCTPLGSIAATNNLDVTYDQWDQIITTALQCNRTSVVNFMFAAAQSFRHYDHIGINQEHHLLSHYQSDFADNNTAPRIEQLRQIQVYEMKRLAALLSALDAVQEGTGTLLDNTVLVMFSEMSESNNHGFDDMPVLLAGGGGGRIVSNGKHVRAADNADFVRVLLTSIRAAGVEVEKMGVEGETRSLEGILA